MFGHQTMFDGVWSPNIYRLSRPKKQKQKTVERLLPFVTTYHPAIKKLKQIVMEHWNLIENQPLLNTIFKKASDHILPRKITERHAR